jgi:vacuolar-type H+-ATPase subunit I/STV1
MVAVLSGPLAAEPRRFYAGFALACAFIAVAGFVPTFWAPLAAGRLELAPITALHAALFYGWIVLFVAQTSLAATGRYGHHRALGVVGVLLAAAMLVVGWMVAIHSYHVHSAAGHAARAGPFLIAPLTNMLFFAGTVAIAAANVRRPDVHKRLMVLATAVVVTPAIARAIQVMVAGVDAVGAPPIERTIVAAIAVDLLILVAIAYDWRTRGRPHPVYVFGLGLWVALQVGRIPLAHTPAWHATVAWLTG